MSKHSMLNRKLVGCLSRCLASFTALYCALLLLGPAQRSPSQMLSTAPCLLIFKQCVPCLAIHIQACCVDSIFPGRVAAYQVLRNQSCIQSVPAAVPRVIVQADYCSTAAALLTQSEVHLKYNRPSFCPSASLSASAYTFSFFSN